MWKITKIYVCRLKVYHFYLQLYFGRRSELEDLSAQNKILFKQTRKRISIATPDIDGKSVLKLADFLAQLTERFPAPKLAYFLDTYFFDGLCYLIYVLNTTLVYILITTEVRKVYTSLFMVVYK
jgi:hypothetical protein